MVNKFINLFKKFKIKYLYHLVIFLSLYITFSMSNIYFSALSGADNYKYIQNILYLFGESSEPYDNQGLLYYFIVSLVIKMRTESFEYFNNQAFLADTVDAIFLSEAILLANFILFIFGLVGFYYLMKKIEFNQYKSLVVILFFCYFPTFYYLRLNMKPEILAFTLLPWIFFFFEDFLDTKQNRNIISIGILSAILMSTKGSIAAMVAVCLLAQYIINYKRITLKQISLGFLTLLIAWGSILVENYFFEIGSLLDRQPEENYNNRATVDFIYTVDFERLRKDPKKDYHRESLLSITMIDLFSDYFELNWKEDSVLFSQKIKPLIVARDRSINNLNLKLINYDSQFKHFVYSGPNSVYLKYQVRYIGLLFSALFIFLIFLNLFRENKKNRVYILFPFFGIFVLLINSIFGIPQNNFDPAVADTFKVFYYSFLVPFSLLIILKNVDLKKIFNLFLTLLFIIFTFINFGFPKINDQQLDSSITRSVENTVLCEFNSIYIQTTLASTDKLICKTPNISGSIDTTFDKIPYISSFLLLIGSFLILLKIKKNEE